MRIMTNITGKIKVNLKPAKLRNKLLKKKKKEAAIQSQLLQISSIQSIWTLTFKKISKQVVVSGNKFYTILHRTDLLFTCLRFYCYVDSMHLPLQILKYLLLIYFPQGRTWAEKIARSAVPHCTLSWPKQPSHGSYKREALHASSVAPVILADDRTGLKPRGTSDSTAQPLILNSSNCLIFNLQLVYSVL